MIAENRTGNPLPAAGRASFRDPAGRLLQFDNRILRVVNTTGIADLTAFLNSSRANQLIADGSIVGTRRVDGAELTAQDEVMLEHDRIEFPSYPYEWPPEMLYQAAALTLALAVGLLPDGIGLKDATPYNVLFRGPNPVFVDVLSFERREPADSAWLAYAQFVRTFLLPLLAHKHFGLSLDQLFLTRRDGIEPEEIYRWAGPFQKWLPPFLSLVSIPTWLGRSHKPDDASIYRHKLDRDPQKSQFILRSLLDGLRRTLEKVKPTSATRSIWSDYLASNNNYSSEHFEAKKGFVERALLEFRPARVLDVGCNTGFFSSLAARTGARVVAIDYDSGVVGETWRTAHEQDLDILPLVVNLTRPSPGAGWRNAECPSFLERANGTFDAVLMLAVIHHMMVTERIPLAEIVELAAGLTTDLLIVEFIAPQDSMFQRLVRGRQELHQDLNTRVFEDCFRARFDIAGVEHVEGTFRWLYAFRRRNQ